MAGVRRRFPVSFITLFLLVIAGIIVTQLFFNKWNLKVITWWLNKQKVQAVENVTLSTLSTLTTNTPPPWHGLIDIVYPYKYTYILNEPDKCKGKIPFLVLMVPVAPDNHGVRDIIRKTWGNESLVPGVNILRIFYVGLSSGQQAPHIQGKLERESREHRDIIQKDFVDSYRNLTIKTMMMLDWLVSYCPTASYTMKIDTDSFLNVDKLVNGLLDPRAVRVKQDYITGVVIEGGRVRRDKSSKWYVPKEVYPYSTYPLYVSGIGYVLSVDLVKKILNKSQSVKPFFLEDVYVGMCLEALKIKPSYPPRRSYFHLYPFPYDRCQFSNIILMTDINITEFLDYWSDFQKPGAHC